MARYCIVQRIQTRWREVTWLEYQNIDRTETFRWVYDVYCPWQRAGIKKGLNDFV